MTEETTEQPVRSAENETDVAKWSMFGFIGGVIVSVLAMEYYGYIHHPTEADNARIDEFVLLSLSPQYDVKVSPKPSGKEAFCLDGFLLLRPENGKEVAGILVDDKNRAVACERNVMSTPKAIEKVVEEASPVSIDAQ